MVDLKLGRPDPWAGRPIGVIGPVPGELVNPCREKMRGTELTERQQEVLDHIRYHIRTHGMPPSRSELGRTLKLVSKSAIAYHLQALERKGWIQLTPGLDRGIPAPAGGNARVRPRRSCPRSRPGHRSSPTRARPPGGSPTTSPSDCIHRQIST